MAPLLHATHDSDSAALFTGIAIGFALTMLVTLIVCACCDQKNQQKSRAKKEASASEEESSRRKVRPASPVQPVKAGKAEESGQFSMQQPELEAPIVETPSRSPASSIRIGKMMNLKKNTSDGLGTSVITNQVTTAGSTRATSAITETVKTASSTAMVDDDDNRTYLKPSEYITAKLAPIDKNVSVVPPVLLDSNPTTQKTIQHEYIDLDLSSASSTQASTVSRSPAVRSRATASASMKSATVVSSVIHPASKSAVKTSQVSRPASPATVVSLLKTGQSPSSKTAVRTFQTSRPASMVAGPPARSVRMKVG